MQIVLKLVSSRKKIADWGMANFDRTRTLAARTLWKLLSGKPLGWSALRENLYRAYLVIGVAKDKEFGDIWRYDFY